MDLVLLFLMQIFAVFAKHNEWYCQEADQKYQICRKCKTLVEDCDKVAPKHCKCENLKFDKNDGSFELFGGPETCQTDDPFCYVSENSNCDDAEYSSVNDRLDNIWLSPPDVYYSYDACKASIQDDNIGNEKVLQNTKIVGDQVREVLDNNDLGETLEFWFEGETYQSCQQECRKRAGLCGAWSFDTVEEVCYIHTVDSCCGQFGKRVQNSEWISGYSCHQCWSTMEGTECPCPLEDRNVIPVIAFGSGGRSPLHATSSGSLTIQIVQGGTNKCKCIKKRTRRNRIRCKKPICNPDGCNDRRKCRLGYKK